MNFYKALLLTFAICLTACSSPTPSPVTKNETGPAKASGIPSTGPALSVMEKPEATVTQEIRFESVQSLPDPGQVQWTVIARQLQAPLGIENAGDERMFIVERRGLIWVYIEGDVLAEPFLDLRSSVTIQGSEQGLLGLAFHPDYLNNGSLFVNYTDRRGDTVVARFQVSQDPNVADPASEKVILRIQQPYRNHNGGDLAFGPDGFLYIGTGDGGSAGDPEGNAQNLGSLLGKILRVDIDSGDPYTVPADNLSAGRPEIWAYGLRNPWRIHFDSGSGDLYIADVGQNQWEEVNFQPADAQAGWNFGWDFREGLHPYEGNGPLGLVDPVAEYSHQQGSSITGGVVVRDPLLPDWQGVYIYGDFGSGIIWGLLKRTDGSWANTLLWDIDSAISSFGQDQRGRVYLVDYTGRILRLEPAL